MHKVKKIHDDDLIGKIIELSKIANNENSSINDAKKALTEMRSIVNHAGLIFQTSQKIFSESLGLFSSNIEQLNNNTEEYSNDWVKFMHQTYDNDNDEKFEINGPRINITDQLSIKSVDWIKVENNDLHIKINDKTIIVSKEDLQNLTFDYSPNITKNKFKHQRHLGPISSLEMDLSRLKNNAQLFKIEQNKIKTHIVYNLLLHLLLESVKV